MKPGVVGGGPAVFLRIEAIALLTASIWLFADQHVHWWLYPLLLLVPDVSMVGYLRDTKLGALTYNLGHSEVAPVVVLAAGVVAVSKALLVTAAIWFGHIGMDRAMGYGLKYSDSFKHTHLSDLG
jgi:hypothetical protein